MKYTLLVAAIINCLCSPAQEIPTPDYAARPYYLSAGNTLENLERTDATTDFKLKGLGYGGTELYYAAFGEAAKIRFALSRIPRMFISFETNIDPEEAVTLSKAEVKKDRRRFLLSSRSMTGTVRNTENTEIKLTFKKIRTGLFEILLPANLEGGEYAFMPMGDQSISITSVSNIKISCFGLDGNGGEMGTGNANAATVSALPKGSSSPQSEAYPQPDFDNVVYQYSSISNSLIDLERAANAKSEGTFGFLNFNQAVSIKGVSSPVIVPSSEVAFVVRLQPGSDPYTLIELLPCTANETKQTRDFSPAQKKGEQGQTAIPVKFKRVADGVYLITTLEKVSSGQYFFVNKALKEKSIFAFAVQ